MGFMVQWVTVVVLLGMGAVSGLGEGQSSISSPYEVNADDRQAEGSEILEALEQRSIASEVEYVDGPLAPLYDFLIQRRLFKFCKLLREANLEEVLQGLGGSWTLFVPTDASFIFLPSGTLDQLKRNPQLLRDFLLYHFVTGDFSSGQILNEMLVDSMQGAPLRFNVYGQMMTVSGAQILESDLEFELGRVYIIDHPLYPVPTGDLVSHLRTSHRQFFRLLEMAGLVDYLNGGPFTILAPDDDAFNFLTQEFKDALTANQTLLDKILLNHILPGSVYTAGISDGMQVENVGRDMVTFTTKRGLILANDIPIVLPDIHFTNGVIHTLNRVLLPEGVEIDCQCKPSTISSQSPASTRPLTPTRIPQLPTTRRPSDQSFQRQPSRPFGGQPSGALVPNRPLSVQTVRPRIPQPQKPFTPSRIGPTPRPISQPSPITRSPFNPAVSQPQPEIDLNTVVDPNVSGQRKQEQERTTRYPSPPRRWQNPIPPNRGQQPETAPANVEIPVQEITPIVTNAPWKTSRWSNSQPTQPSRYPTPSRNGFRTPTTRRPQPTKPSNSATTSVARKVSQPDISGPRDAFSTQNTPAQVTSWQHRQHVTQTTRHSPSHRTTTQRPARISPLPQRRPTPPRHGNIPTREPIGPPPPEQPSFESNRQRPTCRQRTDRITPDTQNLPVCPDSPEIDPCQRAPMNPADSRPLCPNDVIPTCRDQNTPFNPSDNRPLCPPNVLGQGCRKANQPTYIGDSRPLCTPTTQGGCRDPSSPFNPRDNRPVCRSPLSPGVATPEQPIPPLQNCRKANEPQDRRPLCPSEVQTDCRPFNERPKHGDRRPICQINRQSPSNGQVPAPRPSTLGRQPQPVRIQDHSTKGLVPPIPQPRPPVQQPQRIPNTITTRRPSWQTTQRANQIIPPAQPETPPPETIQIEPETVARQPVFQPQPPRGSFLQPPQPQRGSFLQRPQTSSRPSQPPPVPPGRQLPPQSAFRPTSSPRGSRPPPPNLQTVVSPPQFQVTYQPFRSPPIQNPQPFEPQRTPVNSVWQQTSSVAPQPIRGTSAPRVPVTNIQPVRETSTPRIPTRSTGAVSVRATTSPRIPISVTGTSTMPGEDTRRTLYEIVENPSLLIRGTPVKLTKIFELFHKAGLEDILLGQGPTTAFLPSDDAFAALPKGVVDQLEENPELLRQVLLYHITNVEVLPTAQSDSYTVPSLEGDQLVITMLNGGRLIIISGAKAIAVTRASNGIFYVINQLLYPLPHQDIVGAIQSRPDLSTLSSLLSSSGLSDMLQGQTPHTFLAPTDTAFAQLPQVFFDELTQNSSAVQELLLNHIIEGAHYGREFLTGATYPSARGGKLKFQVVSYGYQVNDINIKTPEIVTGTGVIHLIDQVLLEPADQQFINRFDNSVTDDAGTNQDFPPENAIGPRNPVPQPGTQRLGNRQPTSNNPWGNPRGQPQTTGIQPPPGQPGGHRLSNGQRTSVNQRPAGVSSPPGQTIFQRQPVNQPQTPGPSAVSERQPPAGQTPFNNPPQPGVIPQSNDHSSLTGRSPPTRQSPFNRPQPVINPQNRGQPSAGQRPFNNQPQSDVQPPTQFQPGVQTPLSGANGQQNAADLARAMGLNQFADWITSTGLLEKIHDGGVYTVFAPTDDAVNSLPEDMVNTISTNPEQSRPLLQYHIIPRKIDINSVTNDETSSTLLNGKQIRFNVYQSEQADCKQLVTASGTPVGDILATMGSVQVIPVTQVLYQPTGNLLNIIDASPILQSLSQAIKSARISWMLSGTGPLTFFAPSDTAFQALTPDERKNLINDKQAFTELIKRHLVRGTFFSSGVQEDLEKKSDNNQRLMLSLQEGILTVNSVPVTYSDITATNGVLHVIDRLL